MLAPFRPAGWMFQWAREVATALAENLRPPTHERLAETLRVHRVTITRAWGRPEVRAWLAAQLRVDHDALTAQIERRVAGQALGGSEKHQRLWFELAGRLKGGGGSGDAPKLGDGWTVNIGVPLTPAPDAQSAIDTTAVTS